MATIVVPIHKELDHTKLEASITTMVDIMLIIVMASYFATISIGGCNLSLDYLGAR